MTKRKNQPKKAADSKESDLPAIDKQDNQIEKEKDAALPGSANFSVVGIGASAGGLEAFEAFFKAMPKDSGMAFILVAHLDPTHVSLLPQLLQKSTAMKVCTVEDGMRIQPNHVYVIPPNKDLTILNGELQLLDLTKPRGMNLPIDSFFRSLAADQSNRAIGIVLSGTGSDGALGLKAIKGEAGMVMVQDEKSAKYNGMPRSAAATGAADFILPPNEMPAQLLKYSRHEVSAPEPLKEARQKGKTPDALHKIIVLLRDRTGHDFSLYKKNTICRRIERRMHVHQIDAVMDYVRYLQDSEREIDILFKELLIGVTNFFRDSEAFEILKDEILPQYLKDKPDGSVVRVWAPGCSSGEECYSIAVILHECMENLKRRFAVQIFGTDIDEEAVNVARAGIYPMSISADVSPARLRRYFTEEEGGRHRIKKSIREMLIFAPQNVIKDPPFTKLDMLICRNLLIYLGPELQKKLLPVFHYSLKPGGILFLGSSETIGNATDMFEPINKKWKIYKCKQLSTSHSVLHIPPAPMNREQTNVEMPEAVKKAERFDPIELVETILKNANAPPCVIVDDACNIVYVHGRTGQYLEPALGRASVNIIDMARPGLKAELSTAIRKVTLHKQDCFLRGLSMQNNGDEITVDLTVKPVLEPNALRGLIMIMFEETAPASKAAKEKPRRSATRRNTKDAKQLEQELRCTRENLQTTIEELETSNEELKSTNEELQSTNEELQSTNEELETSKEELQSLNEESTTVNAELQSRIDELAKTNDDIKNLLDSMPIATIFLDADLCVRRFTPKATDIVKLISADIGRPIDHFASSLQAVNLAGCASQVLDDLKVIERQITDENGRFYQMRIMPYRTVSNMIDGVVISFADNTEARRASDEVARQRDLLSAVVNSANDGIAVTDEKGGFVIYNKQMEEITGYSEKEAGKAGFPGCLHADEFCRKKAAAALEAALKEKDAAFQEWEITRKDGTSLPVQVSARAISLCGKRLLVSVVNDISRK